MRAFLALWFSLLAAPAWSADGAAFYAAALFAEERFAEAVEAFAAAGDDSAIHAAALIRLGRMAEARLLTGDDPGRAADAFALAGEIGSARRVLSAGLADRPDDIALLHRLGLLESAAGRPREGLAALSRAAELAPADPAIRLAEIRALTAADLPMRAAQKAEALRRAGTAPDEARLAAEIIARQAYGDHRGALATAEPYPLLAAKPVLAQMLAQSLEALGAHARAAERRKIAETVSPETTRPAVPLGELARVRHDAAVAAGDWSRAAEAALDWARLRPDDGQAAAALLRPEILERVGAPRAFRHLAALVARDPDDPARHMLALDLHAESPGSELLVLAHAHALDHLMDAEAASRATERREQAIDRLMPLGRIIDLDVAAGRVVLTGMAGRAEAWVDPATGRLRRFVQGPRWIEARWSEDGLTLLELAESSGARLWLDWRDGRLMTLTAQGRSPFRAELGADGRVTRIDPDKADRAYNAALALIATWPRSDIAGARWLWID